MDATRHNDNRKSHLHSRLWDPSVHPSEPGTPYSKVHIDQAALEDISKKSQCSLRIHVLTVAHKMMILNRGRHRTFQEDLRKLVTTYTVSADCEPRAVEVGS